MLDFFFRPKRPIAPGTPSRPVTVPAREVPKDAAPQINTAQPEDLACRGRACQARRAGSRKLI
ncbi:hypothetical protein [Salipiger bermudensis]|uniref:hypothetical protein n=1 Tax=Salipiger bermudensis TaxID=344736 RepID=UPI0011856AE8|nr:hypothetical protein [Salipiger bermudensis]